MSDNERNPTVALVLETNNLRSREDVSEVASELRRVFSTLREQTLPPSELAEIVVTHDGLPRPVRERIAGRVACAVEWTEISDETGYYQAKNAGFDRTSAEVVVFGDSDCRPCDVWLERMIEPFADDRPAVVAGRTVYPDGIASDAGTAVDFPFYRTPGAPGRVRNFYANNVAFRREVFDRYRYRRHPELYRGHCLDLALRLYEDGVFIRFAPEAETTHEWPDRLRGVFRKRMRRGADASRVAPWIVETHVPDQLAEFLDSHGRATTGILTGRLVRSIRRLSPDGSRGWSRLRERAAQAAAVGLSAIDAAGAVLELAR